MDVLKSEILRKRQLVEDRNLLVVRILGGRGALAIEDVWGGGAVKGSWWGWSLTRARQYPGAAPLDPPLDTSLG